ncbi:hypothetical protein CY34DRAFT_342717 [Suillus luteus UH-Slu-Lm8-n1]|uniref:WD40 repeat-like protein n=1 Tax=Suillus luteus UH-Slu-Lm8-n1 TaxID=930992 RepID=A0A0C9ZNM9_9AGAM|nr:hypothetical protein CY34DRAFT_342717 [Suillus luteus UH-Slu-Lm8-n1]
MTSGATQPAAAAKNLVLTPVLTLTGHKSAIPSMSYFPDGKRMISGSFDKTTRQWDLEAGKEIEEARDICDHVHVVEVSKDGRWVATGGGDYMDVKLKVREIETGNVRKSEYHSRCIDISADCTLLASGTEDSTVRIWSLETGELVAGPFKSDDTAGALRFSQDSEKLAVKSWRGKHLEVWNVKTQKLNVRVGKIGGVGITSAPVFWTTKDKTIIAAISFTGDCPKAIYEFEPTTLMTVGIPFQGHTCVINSLTLSHDCALLASASDDHTIRLWAFESRQLLASFDVPCPLNIILTPDSRQIAYTTLLDHNIYLCNIPPGILASIRLARQSPRVPRT